MKEKYSVDSPTSISSSSVERRSWKLVSSHPLRYCVIHGANKINLSFIEVYDVTWRLSSYLFPFLSFDGQWGLYLWVWSWSYALFRMKSDAGTGTKSRIQSSLEKETLEWMSESPPLSIATRERGREENLVSCPITNSRHVHSHLFWHSYESRRKAKCHLDREVSENGCIEAFLVVIGYGELSNTVDSN